MASEEARSDNKLTPEQIENWRVALCKLLGPYVTMMPSEAIQTLRDRMQDAMEKQRSNRIKGEENDSS